MSTIASSNPTAHTSHKLHLLNAVSSKAKTGEISATDETALDSAIDTIDSSLSSGTGSSTSARLDPSQMKSRIDGLIADAVSNGTLTDKQATTLKDIFGKGGGKDGEAKIGGAGGPPPGPPPAGGPRPPKADDSASNDADTSTADTNVSSTDTSDTDTSSTTDLLATFIKQLQASQSQGSAYTAGGSGSSSRTASALLLNFEA